MARHTEPHNNYCKLIRKWVGTSDGWKELIYSEENDGGNPGLEVYYYRDHEQGHFYYSRRWIWGKIPSKYQDDALQLKTFINECPPGHKLYAN